MTIIIPDGLYNNFPPTITGDDISKYIKFTVSAIDTKPGAPDLVRNVAKWNKMVVDIDCHASDGNITKMTLAMNSNTWKYYDAQFGKEESNWTGKQLNLVAVETEVKGKKVQMIVPNEVKEDV